jgi:Integrase core domain
VHGVRAAGYRRTPNDQGDFAVQTETGIERLRDECLNQHLFLSLAEARETIDRWRHDYNHLRPHGSLGALTPTEFALLKGQEPQPPQEGEKTDRLYF